MSVSSYNFNKIFNDKSLPYFILSLLLLVTLPPLLYFGLCKEMGLYILSGIIGLLVTLLFIKYPKLWLYAVTASLPFYLWDMSEGLSASDVIIGIIDFGGLYMWLVWMLLVKRKKIIDNIGSFCLILFFILSLFNVYVAMTYETTFIDWFRNMVIFSGVLFYLPFKTHFSNKKDLTILLVVVGISVLATNIIQFYNFFHGKSGLEYAFQLLQTKGVNQTIYTSGIIFGLIFAVYQKKFINKVFLLIIAATSVIALISTLSRTYWVFSFLVIVIFVLYLPFKKKLELLLYVALLFTSFFLVASYAFKSDATVFTKLIQRRLLSSSKGTSDISVLSRVYETRENLKAIEQNLFWGKGVMTMIHFYSPILNYTIVTNTIHNGYIFLLYRFGLPLSLFYLFPMIFFLFKSEYLARKFKDDFYKPLSLAVFCSILLMIISDTMATMIDTRDGTFILAFSYAFYAIAQKKFDETKLLDLEVK